MVRSAMRRAWFLCLLACISVTAAEPDPGKESPELPEHCYISSNTCFRQK